MPIYVSESEFEILEPGVYEALCRDVTDLGRVKTFWEGEERNPRKVRLTFQVDARDSNGKPFYVRRDFTSQLSPKANLTKQLETWRGKPFSVEERKQFDLESLLNKPCRLVIVNAVSQSTQKLWANIETIMPHSRGAKPPNPDPDFVRAQDRPNYQPPAPDPKPQVQLAKEAAEEKRRMADFLSENDLPADGAYKLALPAVEPVAVAAGEYAANHDDVPF
jgi:hypothetical protein